MGKANPFSRFFQSIDMFGLKTEFRIDNKQKFTTTSGGFFTLIYVGFIIFLFLSFGSNMINREDPETGVSQTYQTIPYKTIVSRNDYFFVFGMQNSSGLHFIDEEIYSAVLTYGSKKNGTVIRKTIPLEPCSLENMVNNPKLISYFSSLSKSLSDMYCISKENQEEILIQGAFDQKVFDYLSLKTTPCNKAARICKSDEEIKKVLKKCYFAYYSTDNLFDMSNYENPAQTFGRNYYIETTYDVKKIINRYLKTNRVLSNIGWIANSISESDYFSFDTDRESFQLLEDFGENLVEMSIRKSYYESIFTRKYKKIQNVFAEMAGFLQIIFVILYFISNPFIKKEYYESLTNSIYNFEFDEEDEILKKKDKKRSKNKKSTVEQTSYLESFQKIVKQKENQLEIMDSKKSSPANEHQKRKDDEIVNHFFKLKESPLNLTIMEMIKGNFIHEDNLDMKKTQRKAGISNIFSQLDIKFLLKKFSELDKLKMLLLNESQYHLFEYLPKPVILKNSKIHLNYIKKTNSPIKRATNEIINHQDDSIKKAKTVQKAYNDIMKQENMSELDRKLLESLDEDILKLLANKNITMNEDKNPEKPKLLEMEEISVDKEKESIFSEKREELKMNKTTNMFVFKKV